MDNQLKELISLCEEERIRLQELIKGFVADEEYLLAHYHFEAFARLNSRLQTLHNIEDPLYQKKEFRRETIARYTEDLETETSEYLKEYYKETIERSRKDLERLERETKQATNEDDTHIFDEALDRLSRREIKNLRLVLKRSDNLYFTFFYSRKVLKVTLPNVKQLTKQYTLYEDRITFLENLGFVLNENETQLTLKLTGAKEIVIKSLKVVLAKIVFELFYFLEFQNESAIQFTEIVP